VASTAQIFSKETIMEEKKEIEKPTVPPQIEGAKKDIEHSVTTVDENDARKLFMIARNRLMDINHWEKYSHPVTATFRLTDPEGRDIERTAEKGDYFRIDLPGPGTVEGQGYDWVHIEAIDDRSNPDGANESIAIRVRPSFNPQRKGENVAHFFKDISTSSFVLERNGKKVTAGVYGRNEVPNTETSNVVDKVRNALVGATAIAGFSNIQWKNLVKGLIETN
jgi:hypothetical protein